MLQPNSDASREQIVDTMVELTRLSNRHRAIIAGADSLELYLALRRRGFLHVATTVTCRLPQAEHSVGLIAGASQDGLKNVTIELKALRRTETKIDAVNEDCRM
jgi:hypothetical protein